MKKKTTQYVWSLLAAACMAAPMWAQEAATDVPVVTSDSVAVAAAAPVATAADAEQLLAAATAAYESGRYAEAIEAYEALAAQSGTSASLNYNLGNAYYKAKQYAQAILHYERALLQDPADEDIAANLELARANTVDKIERIEPMIFAQWSDSLRNCMSSDAWAWTSVAMFLLFIVGLAVYLFLHGAFVRRAGFFGGLLALALCLVAINYAGQQRDQLMVRNHAVVMSPTVTVRSSPAESGTQLFTLHEGTKVKVRSTLGAWLEIELADGNVGWIPAQALEVI